MKEVHSAFVKVLLSRGLSLVVVTASIAVLGRLLGPLAFGHFALAMAVFTLVRSVAEFGLHHFVVRAPDLGQELTGRAIGLSLTVAAGTVAVSVPATLLATPWLLPAPTAAAFLLMVPVLLIQPFVLIGRALLEREIDFGLISVMEVVRTLSNGSMAILAAWYGAGPSALAIGFLAGELAAGALLLGAGGVLFKLVPRFRGWGEFGGFGARFVATDLLPNAVSMLLMALLSTALGAATLGLYNRAMTLRDLLDRALFDGIKPVVLPVITRTLRQGDAPADIHRIKIDLLAAICWPAFLLIALLAEPLVLTLLGERWHEAIAAVRILAMLGLTMPVVKMSLKFFIAVDLMHVYFRIQLVQQSVRLALAGAAAWISLEAFCAALVLAASLKAGAVIIWVGRRFGPGRPAYAAIALRNLAVAAATLVGPAAILLATGALGTPLAVLALCLPSAAVGWIAGLALTRHTLLGHVRLALASLPTLKRQRV